MYQVHSVCISSPVLFPLKKKKKKGAYPYMRDLIGLQSFKPISPPRPRAEVLNRISTPLKQQAWQQQLASHPDKTFADYIINGISEGFRIGFNRAHTLKATKANIKSPREHPEIIGDYLSKELSKGRTIELHPLDITTNQQIWGYSQETSARTMASHC